MTKKISTVSLNRALPLLVITSFGLLLLFSMFYQYQLMQSELHDRSLEDVRRMLANSELRIETFIRHQETSLIAEEIAGYGVDPNINSIVLLSDDGIVINATRLEWVGRPFQEVTSNFNASKFQRVQLEINSQIELSSDHQRILGYQPVMLALEPGQIRSNRIGVLVLDYDLAHAKSASWALLLTSLYPIWAVGLVLIVILESVISHWINRPLRHLQAVVSRFAAGEYTVLSQLTGKGELATLGDALNRLSKELALAIHQLEENKERFAVTLYSIGDGVIATDTQGCITFMNEIAQKLTAWNLKEASGQPLEKVFNIIDASTRQTCETNVKQVLATGKIAVISSPTLLIARDHTEYQIANTVAPIRTRRGITYGVVLVFRDVTEEYTLRETLFNERALLKALINAVPDLIFYKDTHGKYLGCNKAFAQFTGRAEEAHIGLTDFEFFEHKMAELMRHNDLKILEINQSIRNEDWVTYPNGQRILLDTVQSPFYSAEGKLLGLVGVSRDVTERKLFEEQLADKEERIRSLGNNLPNGYIYQYAITDNKQIRFQFISAGVENVHGLSVEEVLDNPKLLQQQIDPDYWASYQEAERLSAIALSDFSMELPLRNTQEKLRWIQLHARPKRVEGQTIWDGLAIDITDKKLSEHQIWQQANFDTLTGLPNRQMFFDRLEQEINKSQRNERGFALFFLDLDRFKEINDTLGHAQGDQLLMVASQRLKDCVRSTDTVSRLGGDEFTLILSNLDIACNTVGSQIVERIARNILSRLSEPFLLGGEQRFVSASIGITLYPSDADELGQLIKNADQAMYAAKGAGRNCFRYFTTSMQDAAQYRLNMAQDLRIALAQNQFQLHYQPIVDLRTGEINKTEALIRWQHPLKGNISPAQFIPIAEEIGLIHEIGDWVFKKAAQQAKKMHEIGNRSFQISVNKSPVQFHTKSNKSYDWTKYLESLGLKGDNVVIEITEGLLLDASDVTSKTLIDYRDAGIAVSLDDFGTGYSSLAYLKKFDIDFIKIDQSFVRSLAPNSGDMALCEAMIVMAHKLGIMVIAEGIETEEQRQLLAAASCDFGQGYLFSKPVPANELETLLGKNKFLYEH